jgi:hypothetical protein
LPIAIIKLKLYLYLIPSKPMEKNIEKANTAVKTNLGYQ